MPSRLIRQLLFWLALIIIPVVIIQYGVSKAGYSVKEEVPYFLIVFLIPTLVALLVWRRYSGA